MLCKRFPFAVGGWLLGAAVLLTGLPVWGFDFVRWDDDITVLQNPLLTDPWSWDLVGRLFGAEDALRFKPVHWLLLRAVHAVAGTEPAAWHLIGLGLHAGAAVLFAWVLRRTLTLFQPSDWRTDLTALVAAALWALHPLRAEPVAWVTASTYPLTGVLVLGSFQCYLAAPGGGQRRGVWLAASWLLAVLAYGSYPVAATYGLWLVAFDLWRPTVASDQPAWAQAGRRDWWLKQAAFIAPAVLAVGITLLTRVQTPGIFTPAPDLDDIGLPLRVVGALAVYAALGWRLVYAVGLTPNVPPLNPADAVTLAALLAGAVGTVVVLALTWNGRRTRPGLALVIWGGLALALPCLGLTERPNWPVDRYSYLVHLVWVGGLAAGCRLLTGRWLTVALTVAAVLGAISGYAFRTQLGIWRDSEALFKDMEGHPGFAANPRQQGHIYILWARFEATRHRPARAAELFNRAQDIYLRQIQLALQRADYAEALSYLSHEEHHFGLTPVLRREQGAWLLALGRVDEARAALRQAQAALPDDARVRQLLEQADAAGTAAASRPVQP